MSNASEPTIRCEELHARRVFVGTEDGKSSIVLDGGPSPRVTMFNERGYGVQATAGVDHVHVALSVPGQSDALVLSASNDTVIIAVGGQRDVRALECRRREDGRLEIVVR